MNRADIKMAIDLADQLDDKQDSFRISNTLMDCGNEIARLEQQLSAAQAKIDELMLEYCPDEMTQEQIAEYAKHQRAVIVPKEQVK